MINKPCHQCNYTQEKIKLSPDYRTEEDEKERGRKIKKKKFE